ncbi:trypsin-like serine peptidase [Rhodovulum sp. DZ06]|uniref:trypsin-like serine peptidase n=1 Tax=Rhodovulum sp. DZ06 TaxID=3425126 RepID=UPI003D354710
MMHTALRRAAAYLALSATAAFLVPSAAPAQETAARRMLPDYEQREWRGVGRLNITGGGYCTATLLSETLAVTAAHCLYDDLRRRYDTEVYFAAGYRDGTWEAIRQARRTAVHPDYVPTRGRRMKIDNVYSDIALVELDAPVLGSRIPHYPPDALPAKDGAVALLSYGRGRSFALSLQEPCRVRGRDGDIARLTCEVAPGSSGAPVFRRAADGAPQMVAIISGHDRSQTYAAVLDAALPTLKARLKTHEVARKSVAAPGAGAAAGGGGAFKSVRPGGGLSGGSAWQGRRPPGG